MPGGHMGPSGRLLCVWRSGQIRNRRCGLFAVCVIERLARSLSVFRRFKADGSFCPVRVEGHARGVSAFGCEAGFCARIGVDLDAVEANRVGGRRVLRL